MISGASQFFHQPSHLHQKIHSARKNAAWKNENLKLARFEKWSDRPLKSFIQFFKDLDFEIFAIDESGAPNFDQYLLSLAKNLFAMPNKYVEYFKLKN